MSIEIKREPPPRETEFQKVTVRPDGSWTSTIYCPRDKVFEGSVNPHCEGCVSYRYHQNELQAKGHSNK